MDNGKVDFYIFSGSGNTWLLANEMARIFSANNVGSSFYPMPGPFSLPEKGTLLGFAFPTAYFSTYPFLLSFFAGLPKGQGQPVFMLTSMAGATGGMPQAIRRLFAEKGYSPIGYAEIKMPSNYGKDQSSAAHKNETITKEALVAAEKFAGQLLTGKSRWPAESSFVPGIMQKMTANHWSTGIFRRFFPLQVVEEYCIKCGFCQSICPAAAIEELSGGLRRITGRCQSCQHCSAFCPTSAIRLPGQTEPSYKAVDYDKIKESFIPKQ